MHGRPIEAVQRASLQQSMETKPERVDRVTPMGVGFSPDRLRRVARMEGHHFWFVGRRWAVAGYLKAIGPLHGRVLDVGCGTGTTTQWLADRGLNAIGLDRLAEGLRALHDRQPAIPLIQGSAEKLPFGDQTMAAVIFLDVLEHLDDQAALYEAARVLQPGGWLLASVPAMPWLWSARDVAAGHHRRYTHSLLEARLTEAGFRLVAWRYYAVLLFPLILLTRFLSRCHPRAIDYEEQPGPFLNRALTIIVWLEITLGRWLRWPIGSTLLAVARREAIDHEV